MESFDLNTIKIFRQSTLSYGELVLASTPYANNKKVTHFVFTSISNFATNCRFRWRRLFYGLSVQFAIRGRLVAKYLSQKHKQTTRLNIFQSSLIIIIDINISIIDSALSMPSRSDLNHHSDPSLISREHMTASGRKLHNRFRCAGSARGTGPTACCRAACLVSGCHWLIPWEAALPQIRDKIAANKIMIRRHLHGQFSRNKQMRSFGWNSSADYTLLPCEWFILRSQNLIGFRFDFQNGFVIANSVGYWN